jgi:hypothetical protein
MRQFDEIHLIISRPVQKEIDKHKNSGGNRLAKNGRARSLAIICADIAD